MVIIILVSLPCDDILFIIIVKTTDEQSEKKNRGGKLKRQISLFFFKN